jgi:hypothetical protein
MHPIQFAKTTGAHFVAVWLAATALACDSAEPFNYCPEPECFRDSAADGSRRDTPLPPDALLPDSGMSRSPLCGVIGCFPGNRNACGPAPVQDAALLALRMADDASDADNDVMTDGPTDAGTAADAVDAPGPVDAARDVCGDSSHDASVDVSVDSEPDATVDADDEPPPDVSEDVREDADGGLPPTVDAGTADSARADAATDIGMSDEPKISQSCYIKPAPTTGVVTECAPIGPGAEGSACNDSHECGALMACIEVNQKSVCRAVSCGLPPLCLKGTYHQEAPLRVNGATRRDLNVPVCLPVDDCTLLAPNACPNGKVCAVVGNEGETTCMDPGSTKVGESCDDTNRCAEGLLCSKFSNQCVRICHVDADANDCPTGTCQGGNRSLPDGFGICVGQTDGG